MNESDLSDNNIQNIQENYTQQLIPVPQPESDLSDNNIQNIQENYTQQLVPLPEPPPLPELILDSTYQIPSIEQLVPEPGYISADFQNNPLIYQNNEYQLLYDNNINNPFYQSLINKLDYNTDEEENNFIRIIYSWKYEINYDYFDFKNINIFISKNNKFKNKLNELKQFRNYSNLNSCISGYEKTGNIKKIKNIINITKNSYVYTYFIIYYDNTKVDIIFYGIFNQKIDEEKLINNIIFENKFGKKGIITNNNLFNLNNYDFIVFYKKVIVE